MVIEDFFLYLNILKTLYIDNQEHWLLRVIDDVVYLGLERSDKQQQVQEAAKQHTCKTPQIRFICKASKWIISRIMTD